MTPAHGRVPRAAVLEITRARPDVTQIVTFRVGSDLFAADVRAVERVLRYQVATPVPNVPPWVAGVLEYQRHVVPVIDFRLRFHVSVEASTADTRILVFNTDDGWMGGIVDAVLDVSAVDAERLESPPPLLRGLEADYLHGVVRRDNQLVLLLDTQRVLSSTERVLLREMTEASTTPQTLPPTASQGPQRV